jgi:hypothetical protein
MCLAFVAPKAQMNIHNVIWKRYFPFRIADRCGGSESFSLQSQTQLLALEFAILQIPAKYFL